MAKISNAYLSQVERGLHQPSLRVLRSIADALDVSGEALLARAGLLDEAEHAPEDHTASSVEEAIRADAQLSEAEKDALIRVYRSYIADQES